MLSNLSLPLTVNFARARRSSGKSRKERAFNKASVWSSGTVSGRDFFLLMSLSSSHTQSCADISSFLSDLGLESLFLSSGTAIRVGLAVEPPFDPGYFKLDSSLLDKRLNSLNRIWLQEEWYWPWFAHLLAQPVFKLESKFSRW